MSLTKDIKIIYTIRWMFITKRKKIRKLQIRLDNRSQKSLVLTDCRCSSLYFLTGSFPDINVMQTKGIEKVWGERKVHHSRVK